jgi:integrase
VSKTGYKRIYTKGGRYYYCDLARKWHALTPVADGEPAMLRALAKLRGDVDAAPGSMAALIKEWREKRLPAYAEEVQKDYGYLLDKIVVEFQGLGVGDVDAHHIIDLRDLWETKPRTANKVRMLCSILFTYAVEKKRIKVNPVRDVARLKPAPRKRYMPNDELLAIGAGAVAGLRHNGTGKAWKNANGEMYAALFDFAYLTGLRAKDCRMLRWADVGDDEIICQPTKTRNSTGARIAIEVTPDVRAVLDRVRAIDAARKVSSMFVFHTLKGGQFSKWAVRSAWDRARERTLGDMPAADRPRFRDLRPKALSDAKRRGVTLDALKDAAGHASVTTTEGYLRGFDTVDAKLGLVLPKAKKASNSDR